MTGQIFNIQHFSVHDGPGIRTVVFLKGCPLRCKWCGNPESQSANIQLAWTKERCIHCNNCTKNCSGQLSFSEEGDLNIKNAGTMHSAEVERICPSEALQAIGEEKSVEDIISIILKDEVFYKNSGGGMTLSGGEPLMQAEFIVELLKEAKRRGIHCALETSGYGRWEDLKKVAGFLDYILYDIKTMEDEIHRVQTGVSNKIILENFRKLCEAYPQLPKHVRTPVIPGFNDNNESIGGIIDFLQDFQNVRYELLKYHKFGIGKYHMLGRDYEMPEAEVSEELMTILKQLINKRLLC